VRLAELHFAAGDHATVLSSANALMASKRLHPTKSQKSFACYRRAKSTYQLHAAMQASDRGLKDAVADYALAIKTDKEAPWAGEALFLQGNILWNQFQDDAAAIKLWKEVLAKYPSSPFAENAGYNIGVLYQVYGNQEKAKTAFSAFRDRFPDSKLLAALNSEGLAGHIKTIKRP
jgi:TolA-binding protein